MMRPPCLNKAILDCAWGDLFAKIAWLAAKSGKPVILVNPKHSSQECPQCRHTVNNPNIIISGWEYQKNKSLGAMLVSFSAFLGNSLVGASFSIHRDKF